MRGLAKAGLMGVVVAAAVSSPAMAGNTAMTAQEKYEALKKAGIFTGLPTAGDLLSPQQTREQTVIGLIAKIRDVELGSVFTRSLFGTLSAEAYLGDIRPKDTVQDQLNVLQQSMAMLTAAQRAQLAAHLRGNAGITNQIVNTLPPELINQLQPTIINQVKDQISQIPPPPPGPQGPAGAQGPQGPGGPAGPGVGGPWVSVGAAHAIVAGREVASVTDQGTHVRVTFTRPVSSCAATATGKGTVAIITTATPAGSDVEVRMWDHEGQSVDVPFSLTLACP